MSGDVRAAAAELTTDLTPGPFQPMSGWAHAVPAAKREAILTVVGGLAPAPAVPGGPPAPGEAVIEPHVLTHVQRVREHLDAEHARTARDRFTPTGASQARDVIDTLLVALADAEARLTFRG
ncbi:hypothetical protein [Cellulosimicrobium sp. Marseille-Q4280]|uniref:hypothetical protein n=1 Tax=Cellulosimicrobium sp. Marseille-Q4280 TaxID=2937992 RepID=UPI00203EA8AF|nr:hypothetical protein [Cellulosimicrobium sp. Marseille-Q4280]